MTDGTSRPMVFGDIHDLLRKVNGESEPAYMWQSDKQGKAVRTEEPPAVQEEQAREPDEKSDKESRLETSEEASAIATPEKVPKAKDKVHPQKEKTNSPPPKAVKALEEQQTKKVRDTPVTKAYASPSVSDIQSQIDTFSYAAETGHRRWVFIPDEVYATFETVYGCYRLSAILTALARSFIDANKDELRRLVTHRSGLFE